MNADPNTSSPQRLPDNLKSVLVIGRAPVISALSTEAVYAFRLKLDTILWQFRVEMGFQQRRYQNMFYDESKNIRWDVLKRRAQEGREGVDL